MKNLILIFFITLGLCSCNSDEIKTQDNLDVKLDMKVTNSKGEDLLNPKNTFAYDQSKIKLFYLVGDDLKEVYDSTKDSPRNFFIFERDGHFIIRVFLNSSTKDQYSTTLIQWNEKDTDTIKSEFTIVGGSVSKKNIWFNEGLILNYEPYFDVSK